MAPHSIRRSRGSKRTNSEIKLREMASIPYVVTPTKAKSRYWRYFGFWANENGVFISKETCVCKICGRSQPYNGNTTNLREHLRIHHKEIYSSLEENLTSNNDTNLNTWMDPAELVQSQLSLSFETFTQDNTNLEYFTVTNEDIQKDRAKILATFLAEDLLPLKTVEKSGFKKLLQSMDPDYNVPSLDAIKTEMKQIYDKSYSELLSDLHKVAGVCVSLEKWSSSRGQHNVTVSVHYVSSDWTLENRVLHSTQIHGNDTSSLQCAYECLHTCQLNQKVTSVTLRNSRTELQATNDAIQKDMIHIPIIECFASFLNQCICEVMCECQPVYTMICKLRNLANHCPMPTVQDMSEREQGEREPFVCDDERSWMSTHEMMVRAEEWRDNIETLASDPATQLTELEWNMCSKVIKILNVAKASSKAMLSQKYACGSSVLPFYNLVLNSLCVNDDNELDAVGEFKENLLQKVRGQYDSSFYREFLGITSFCDPRFKMMFQMSDDERQALLRTIRAKMEALCPKRAEHVSSSDDSLVKEQKADLSLMEDLLANFSGSPEENVKKQPPRPVCCSEKCKNEVAVYLREDRLSLGSDPLTYWRDKQSAYPYLSKLAQIYLCVPGSCVPSAQVFSPDADDAKNQIEQDSLNMLLFLHDHFETKAQ